jgi:hypothetical protein
MLAAFFDYTRDSGWLQANKASILAAWNWIQAERDQTRVRDASGEKADFYGLMPKGRVGDWPEGSYIYTMTDNYTWYGMARIATAFRKAGLPEADRLTCEAEEYRQCILDVMHREEGVDPETGLFFVPNAVFYKKGYRASWWMADGPIQLFYTGLLDPQDKRFAPMFEYNKRKHGVLLGMHETYGHPDWYNNQTDHTYYMCYLARGEYEKALLTFYSSFVYGTSDDCYQTQERTHMYEPMSGPYHLNASNIGRLLGMQKRMLIDEQDADAGKLWLLRGCPRRWFAKGETIVVENAPTLFGKMAVSTKSDGKTITVEIACPERESPKEIRVAVRHPDRKPLMKATANGQPARIEGEAVVLASPIGSVTVQANY